MEIVLSILIGIVALFVLTFVWFKLGHDRVGKKERIRRTAAGLQGRLDEWLYWQAPLTKPPMKRLFTHEPTATDPPWLRALQTIIRAEASQSQAEPEAAYNKLLARHPSPLATSFLRGQVSKAIKIHWRGRYRGPDGLFFLWLYLIAFPRYGRRHLYLDALSAALKEFRTP